MKDEPFAVPGVYDYNNNKMLVLHGCNDIKKETPNILQIDFYEDNKIYEVPLDE